MRALALMLAVSDNGVIGHGGQVPWHHPEDLLHFQTLTEGHAVLMGRRTYEEVGEPLPKRRNLVISATLAPAPGREVFATFDDALKAAYETDPEPFVIGGARVYEAALPFTTTVWMTRVHEVVEGDTFVTLDLGAFERVEARRSGLLTFERWVRTSRPAQR